MVEEARVPQSPAFYRIRVRHGSLQRDQLRRSPPDFVARPSGRRRRRGRGQRIGESAEAARGDSNNDQHLIVVLSLVRRESAGKNHDC